MTLQARVASTSAALALSLAMVSPQVSANEMWEQIKEEGKIVCGAIPNDPVGSWIDDNTGRWEGYEIELCREIAAGLSEEMGKEIELEFRETNWRTVVLDIQSGKIDLWPGMSATEERKKALTMVGPMYHLSYCGVTGKKLDAGEDWGATWEDLNNPEVRIATIKGTSIEQTFKEHAPDATHIVLGDLSEIALAVQSGRADVLGTDALRCLDILKGKSSVFGKIIFPEPVQTSPSSAGLRKGNEKFASWLADWREENGSTVTEIFFGVLDKAGLDTDALPEGFSF